MLAFGSILNSLTGLSVDVSILISAIVVIFYTYSGGMWAVAITDFVQAGVIIVSFIFVFLNISKTGGGLITVFQQVDKDLFNFFPKESSFVNWLKYIESWIVVGLGSLGAQDLVSRLVAAKSVKVARWSSIIGGVMYWVIGLMPVMLGILATVLVKELKNDSVLISLSLKFLPIPLISLMIGGLLSAIMSSVDSAMLAPSSIIGNNLIPYFVKNVSDRQKLFWCKISVPIIGFGSLLMALYFKNIYTLCLESWAVLLTSITAPLILGSF
jgi:Na+/proline symporter